MRALITGINGFVGHHVARVLLDRGDSVCGTGRTTGDPVLVERGMDFYRCAVDDPQAFRIILEATTPDAVIHLAATRQGSATEIFRTNVLGTACVLDAVTNSRVVIVGSSAMYGDASDRAAQTEVSPLRPVSSYGSSKACTDLLADQMFRSSGVPIMRATPFNIIGPGQRGDYFTANCARQLVEIERGRTPEIVKLGSLEAWRDFLDVRDLARALIAIADRGTPGENYNVCSGVATSVKSAVEILCGLSGITPTIESAQRAGTDVPYQLGSSTKLQAATKWHAEYTLEATLADILEDWRAV